jgi:hypothetical protein
LPGDVAYLDSSAFVKLVVEEPESAQLLLALGKWPDRASSTLLRTETIRALRRSGNDDRLSAARHLFTGMHLIRTDEPILDQAGDLPPRTLRSLDAIHVAAALSIGAALDVAITYDDRRREAFESANIIVIAPR